jgi:hypothetical protein
VRRLVPFLLLGLLTAGTAVGLGVGVSEAPVSIGEIMAGYQPELVALAAIRDDKNSDKAPLPLVSTVRCDLPVRWVIGNTFRCTALTSGGLPQGRYTLTEGENYRLSGIHFSF